MSKNISEKEVLKGIKDILLKEVEIQVSRKNISLESTLINDLGMDSIQILEFIVGLENKFNVKINDEDISKALFKNVGSILLYVVKQIKKRK